MLATIALIIHKVCYTASKSGVYNKVLNGLQYNLILSLFYILQKKWCIAELKILVVLSCFIISLIVRNGHAAVIIAEFEPFRNAINSHFLCEAVGYVPGRCSRESFEQYSHPLLNITVYIMALCLRTVNLLFIINCRVLKENIQKVKLLQSVTSSSLKTKRKSSLTDLSQQV